MSMVTGNLTGRMGDRSILPVKLPVTIDIMFNFDRHCDGDGNGNGVRTCKHTFTLADHSRPAIAWRSFLRGILGGGGGGGQARSLST